LHKRDKEEAVSPQEIKRELTRRVEGLARFLFPHGKREGNHWCVGSIEGEPGQSFKICIAGGKIGLWGDFDSTEPHRKSLIDLWMKQRGVDLNTALRQCADWLGVPTQKQRIDRCGQLPPVASTGAYLLSKEECSRALQMAVLLRDDARLCERVGRARGWQPQTIRDLTYGPHLGWHEGKLAFIYDSGVKLRWREDGERRFAFAFGKAQTMWRASSITPETQTIIVCEGETDAISAIDAGVEDSGLKTVVVAIPGANIICKEWGLLFRGREAVLCFDIDEAGQKASQKFAAIIAPYAAKIWKPRWDQREAA
jgi:twinkle protein